MRPTTREVLVEWFDSINCVRDSTRFLPAAWAFHHVMTGGVFVVFLARCFSVASVAAMIAIAAGEWHENHHQYPRSAGSGLEWWQVDLPYSMIRGMNVCGVVTQFNARRS